MINISNDNSESNKVHEINNDTDTPIVTDISNESSEPKKIGEIKHEKETPVTVTLIPKEIPKPIKVQEPMQQSSSNNYIAINSDHIVKSDQFRPDHEDLAIEDKSSRRSSIGGDDDCEIVHELLCITPQNKDTISKPKATDNNQTIDIKTSTPLKVMDNVYDNPEHTKVHELNQQSKDSDYNNNAPPQDCANLIDLESPILVRRENNQDSHLPSYYTDIPRVDSDIPRADSKSLICCS